MNNELTSKHYQLIQYITEGIAVEQAAKKTGISFSTARRWLKSPKMQEALARVHGHVEESVIGKITRQFEEMAEIATTTVKSSMDCDQPATRLKAAQLVLDRVAPVMPAASTEQTGPQNTLYDAELTQYMTVDDLETMDAIVQRAHVRRIQAESDRETMERRRA